MTDVNDDIEYLKKKLAKVIDTPAAIIVLRRLRLLSDADKTFTLNSRRPDKRVFKMSLGDQSPSEIENLIRKLKEKYGKKK